MGALVDVDWVACLVATMAACFTAAVAARFLLPRRRGRSTPASPTDSAIRAGRTSVMGADGCIFLNDDSRHLMGPLLGEELPEDPELTDADLISLLERAADEASIADADAYWSGEWSQPSVAQVRSSPRCQLLESSARTAHFTQPFASQPLTHAPVRTPR